MVKKFEDMFIHFDVIHERDGQTDGQTLHDSKDRASHRAVIEMVRNRAEGMRSRSIGLGEMEDMF